MAVPEKVKKAFVWIYWIAGLLLIGAISNILYTRFNKQVAAILVFLASFLALYYYYVKWFVIGDTFQPPISVCPDYLTLLGPVKEGSSQFVCVDTLGVSTKFPVSSTNNRSVSNALQGAFNSETPEIPAEGGIYTSSSGGVVITPDPDVRDMTTLSGYCNNLRNAGLSSINLCTGV
jgi:hypothetical protein